MNPETATQIGIMTFLRRMQELENCRRFMAFHVPNGGKRGKDEAGVLKRMGVMPGVADIQILLKAPRHGYPASIFIELKHLPQRVSKQGKTKGRIVNAAGNGQEEPQERFQQRVTALGFDYRLVRATCPNDGLKQVLGIMAEYGVTFSGAGVV